MSYAKQMMWKRNRERWARFNAIKAMSAEKQAEAGYDDGWHGRVCCVSYVRLYPNMKLKIPAYENAYRDGKADLAIEYANEKAF